MASRHCDAIVGISVYQQHLPIGCNWGQRRCGSGNHEDCLKRHHQPDPLHDRWSFKSVDEYQLHQLVTAITEGAERPEATTIRQQFVNIAGMVFDWRDTVAINVKKFATNTAKMQAYGIRVNDDLKAVVILANVEWAARQSWGTKISIAHCTIKEKYRYNHTHDTASIKEILKVLTGADEARGHPMSTVGAQTIQIY